MTSLRRVVKVQVVERERVGKKAEDDIKDDNLGVSSFAVFAPLLTWQP